MKIADLVIGSSATITLLVKEATILLTSKKKPYLNATLTDGNNDIKAINWDWVPNEPAWPKNTVVEISGQVGEYLGVKQLTINKATLMHGADTSQFAAKGGVDVELYNGWVRDLISQINHPHLKDLVRNVLNKYLDEFTSLPAAKGIHHAFVHGLIKHSVDVTHKAMAIARYVPTVNMDLVIAGALLHDIGKVHNYMFDGALIEATDDAALFEHIIIGVKITEALRTPENQDVLDLIQHIITSHHGKLEYGSPQTPKFLEAHIISAADGIDAKTQTILELNAKAAPDDKYTAKEWTLDNRPQFTQNHIKRVMTWTEDEVAN